MELLKELTIIIPTYNRPLELEKSIEFWSDSPVSVFIIDGSDRPFFNIGLQPDTNSVYYHNFPKKNETEIENWAFRLNFGVSKIKTKFAALCCDDDVFEIDSLIQALRKLETNSDVDAVIGRTAEYKLTSGSVRWCEKYRNWKDESYRKSNNMYERVVCDDGVHAFYGIYKAEKLKNIHSICSRFSFPIPVWQSSLVIHLTKVFCRIEMIDILLWLKHGENYLEARPIKFANLFYDPTYSEFAESFIEAMSEAIRVAEPVSTDVDILNITNGFRNQYQAPKRRTRFLVVAKAQVLRTIASFPKVIRVRIFQFLPQCLKLRVGDFNFRVNYTPIHELTSSDLSLEYLKKWERILLMPREELRLRANI